MAELRTLRVFLARSDEGSCHLPSASRLSRGFWAGATALSQPTPHRAESRRNRRETHVLEFGPPLAFGAIGPPVRDDTSRVDWN